MYFGKIPHPENFCFLPRHEEGRGFVAEGGAALASSLEKIGPNAWRLRVETGDAARYSDLARYETKLEGEGACTARIGGDGALVVMDESGAPLLAGKPGAMLGLSGSAWLLQFEYDPRMKFYGFGEHCRGFEKTGQRAKFWNTDVWGDYPLREVFEGEPESLYVSIPWMIVRSGDAYAGILVRHPGAVFFDAASNFVWDGKNRDDADRNSFYVGAGRSARRVFSRGTDVAGADAPDAEARWDDAAAPALGPRPPPVPLGLCLAGGFARARPEIRGMRHSLRRVVAGYRIHGRLPGLLFRPLALGPGRRRAGSLYGAGKEGPPRRSDP
jgi:hypothetical protein